MSPTEALRETAVHNTHITYHHMNTIHNIITRGTACALTAAMLSNCYFNSAGHIFDKASYDALTSTADIRPGDLLYCDGGRYYVELPRYRWDYPVRTQYSAFDDEEERKKTLTKKNDYELVEIPEDYAMYLIGKRNQPTTPSFMNRVGNNAEAIKKRSQTYKIARTPKETLCHFHYNSPSSFGWYTLGVLDWLCVDLPITCTENALVAALFAGFVLTAAENPSSLKPKSHETSDDSPSPETLIALAQRGDADAQYAIGLNLLDGSHGFPKNDEAAFTCFLAAAKQGHAKAQYFTGSAYLSGKVVQRNDKEAVRWLSRSAEAGCAYGQYSLGLCYEVGAGVKRDIGMAKYWYRRAAAQGDEDAAEALRKLGE